MAAGVDGGAEGGGDFGGMRTLQESGDLGVGGGWGWGESGSR